MIPYLVANTLLVKSILQNDVLSRHAFNIFPMYSTTAIIITFLVSITRFDPKSRDQGVVITSEMALLWQVLGGLILAGLILILYLLATHQQKKACIKLTTFAVLSLILKCLIYRTVYWGIILDVVFLKYLEQCKFRRRLFLLGAYRFGILAELGFFLILLTQMNLTGCNQTAVNSCFCVMLMVTGYNLLNYWFFKWRIKREIAELNRHLGIVDGIGQNNQGLNL